MPSCSPCPEAPPTRTSCPPDAAPLTHDANDSLVETLETYLDCCGDATRTAGALCIHRSTLYDRLSRIETIAQIDLHDGSHRLALHLGVKMRRVLAAYGLDENT